MTGIEVIDSAVKIGLGALISAVSGFLYLSVTHSFERFKRREDYFYKAQEERKKLYIDFSSKSLELIEKYDLRSCNPSDEDYRDLLMLYSHMMIICTSDMKVAVSTAFNAVSSYIILNKVSASQVSENGIGTHIEGLRSKAREEIFSLQYLAQEDAVKVFPEAVE